MSAAAQRIPAATTAQDVDRWFRFASPGDTFVYFTGNGLPKAGDSAVAMARKLIDDGLVLPFQKRIDTGLFEYCLTRRANAEPRSRGRGRVIAEGPGERVCDEAARLLAVLRRLANLGQPCPVNAVLAEKAALKDRYSVKYRLKQLEDAGSIRITWPQDSIRIVTIVESGRRTAKC